LALFSQCDVLADLQQLELWQALRVNRAERARRAIKVFIS
jgi:hypothetical protein